MGTPKGLITAFATRLLNDYKSTVILTFHIGKLRASSLGRVLIPSVIFTKVDEDEIVKEVISNLDLSKVVKSKTRDQDSNTN